MHSTHTVDFNNYHHTNCEKNQFTFSKKMHPIIRCRDRTPFVDESHHMQQGPIFFGIHVSERLKEREVNTVCSDLFSTHLLPFDHAWVSDCVMAAPVSNKPMCYVLLCFTCAIHMTCDKIRQNAFVTHVLFYSVSSTQFTPSLRNKDDFMIIEWQHFESTHNKAFLKAASCCEFIDDYNQTMFERYSFINISKELKLPFNR